MSIDRKTFPLSLDAVLDNAGPTARERDDRNRARVSAGISAFKERGSAGGRTAPSVARPAPQPTTVSGNAPAAAPVIRQNLLPAAVRDTARGSIGISPDRARQAMVARLRDAGVSDGRVLNAMGQVPRHLFIDSGFAGQAYEDAALPIGYQQTISKPSIVARKLELLCRAAPPGQRLGRVLEIGTGCGYQAAVLSLLAQEVYSIERIRALHDKAKSNLRSLRIPNLRLHYGDGMQGLPQVAPFAAIIVAAAGLEIPPGLLDQLAEGGCLVAPVTAPDGRTQRLQFIGRERDRFVRRELEAVFFVPLKSGTI